MGHSTGISDSYYRATENELLEDYLKARLIFLLKNLHMSSLQNSANISS
jgi:hypothetical protein